MMALTWNIPDESLNPSLPIRYLRDYLKPFCDLEEDERSPEKMLPRVISSAYWQLYHGNVDIHPKCNKHYIFQGSDFFRILTDCLSEWISCIHVEDQHDRHRLIDAIVFGFSLSRENMDDYISAFMISYGAQWILDVFDNDIHSWFDTVHLDSFQECRWRYYVELVICSNSNHDRFLSTYSSLWSHLDSSVHPDDFLHNAESAIGYKTSMWRLVEQMITRDPSKLNIFLDVIQDEASMRDLSINLFQQHHLEKLYFICISQEQTLADDPVHYHLHGNSIWTVFLQKYSDLQSFSKIAHRFSYNTTLEYLSSTWVRNNILTQSFSTSSVGLLLDMHDEISFKRTILEHVLRPVIESPTHKKIQYKRGMHNITDADKRYFFTLCQSEDLGIRVLCVVYMLRQFDPYDYAQTPFQCKALDMGSSSVPIFSNPSTIFSTFIPELIPMWSVFSDLKHQDLDSIDQQMHFLWDYYQQHYIRVENNAPLELTF